MLRREGRLNRRLRALMNLDSGQCVLHALEARYWDPGRNKDWEDYDAKDRLKPVADALQQLSLAAEKAARSSEATVAILAEPPLAEFAIGDHRLTVLRRGGACLNGKCFLNEPIQLPVEVITRPPYISLERKGPVLLIVDAERALRATLTSAPAAASAAQRFSHLPSVVFSDDGISFDTAALKVTPKVEVKLTNLFIRYGEIEWCPLEPAWAPSGLVSGAAF